MTLPRTDILLIDASFLYALADKGDAHRKAALDFAQRDRRKRIIPDVVLTEVLYLVGRFVSHYAMMRFLQSIANSTNMQFEPVSQDDLKRAHSIMAKYSDAHLDFVNCCIMALSERMNASCVCTFDRTDFALFKLTHCEYLELLP